MGYLIEKRGMTEVDKQSSGLLDYPAVPLSILVIHLPAYLPAANTNRRDANDHRRGGHGRDLRLHLQRRILVDTFIA